MRNRNEYNMHISLWSGYGQFNTGNDSIMYAILKYRGVPVSDMEKLFNSIQRDRLQRIVDSFKSMASHLALLHSHGV